VYTASQPKDLPSVPVHMGKADAVQPKRIENISLVIPKSKLSSMTCQTEYEETLSAPVTENTVVGKMRISDGEKILAEVPIPADCAVEKVTFWDLWKEEIRWLFAANRG